MEDGCVMLTHLECASLVLSDAIRASTSPFQRCITSNPGFPARVAACMRPSRGHGVELLLHILSSGKKA
jgi:hypothetical protein